MAKTLEQILYTPNLIGLIENPAGGVPDFLPPAFTKPGQRVDGDTAKWFEVTGNRQTARLVQYGSPSQRREGRGAASRTAKFMHTHEHIHLNATTLMQLQDYSNPQRQKLGMQTLANETKQARLYLDNLRLSAIYSILALGAVYFDGNGNLLPSSTGSVTTVDFSVPANNKNQWNGIIGASWATATTDIIADIKAVQRTALQGTGYPLAHAFYGENLLGYFMGNDDVKELLKTRNDLAGAFMNMEIPDGFLGLKWHPVESAFYNDSAGTNQAWFGVDALILTPEPSPDWFEILEGTFPVPRNVGTVAADASAIAGQIDEVSGMFTYAKLTDDPVGIRQNYGDTFLPCLKVPSAIYIGDVTP